MIRKVFFVSFAYATLQANVATADVSVAFDERSPAIGFAAARIEDVLAGRGLQVTSDRLDSVERNSAATAIIIATEDSPVVQRGLRKLPDIDAEGYAVRVEKRDESIRYWVVGADSRGAMYGGLDIADLLLDDRMFDNIEAVVKSPYIRRRGLKFNIPLDARTPSYSDANIVSQYNIPYMWDMTFWRAFFDEMALNRLNLLTLWSLAPFPSLVKVPEYPNVGLDDVMRTSLPVDQFGHSSSGAGNVTPEVLANLETVKEITLEEKIRFWQEVMQYANDRGVDIYLYTWNVFAFGTEDSGYGITDDVQNPVTRDYIRAATRTLLETYPLLKGIGVTAGEHMSHDSEEDERFLFETYGRGVGDALKKDPGRRFQIIHRLGDELAARTAFADLHPNATLGFAFKYSKAHAYSSVDPYWIDDSNFLKKIGEKTPFFVTVRDDSYNYLRGGSDPEFVRDYVRHMPNSETNLEGFQLGPDSKVWGRENVTRDDIESRPLTLERRWYSFRLWGKLGYDPTLPDSHFVALLADRFQGVNARKLLESWAAASQVVPLVNRFHNHKAYLDYQWNPELCDSRAGYNSETGFHDIHTFLRIKVQRDEGLMGIPAYVRGDTISGTPPFGVARDLMEMSRNALEGATALDVGEDADIELRRTVSDIRAMGHLGGYYSHKIAATTNLAFYLDTDLERYKNATIEHLQEASEYWWNYSHEVDSQYKPMWYSRLRKHVDILDIQQQVDKEITDLGGEVPAHEPWQAP